MKEIAREISVLKRRILEYADSKGIKKYEIYQNTGISNGVLSQKGGLSEDNVMRFLSHYSDLSPEWLLTGKGAMLRGQSAPEVAPPPSEPAFPGFIEEIKSLSVKVGRLEAENEHLRAAIEAKQKEIEAQRREIEDKEREIKRLRIDQLKKGDLDFHSKDLEPAHASLSPENPVESAELLKSQPQEALFTP